MKKLQTLFIALIFVLILGICSSTVLAVDQMLLNIDDERPFSDDNGNGNIDDTYVLMVNGLANKIFKIGEATDDPNTLDFTKTLYCLRFGLGFGDGRSVASVNTRYSNFADMKQEPDKVIQYYQGIAGNPDLSHVYTANGHTFTPYNAMLWLIDNLALPTNQTSINKLIQDANISNPVLTVDDIDVVQQIALWYFSNYDEGFMNSVGLTNALKLLVPGGDINDDDDLIDFEGNLTIRGQQMETLFNYLINSAIENGNSAPGTITRPEIELDNTLNASIVEREFTLPGDSNSIEYYVVGPFKVNITGGEPWDITVTPSFQYTNSSADNAQYYSVNGLTIKLDSQGYVTNYNYNIVNGEEFYVAINKNDVTDGIKDFKLRIDYMYQIMYRYASIWTATASDQPVLYLREGPIASGGDAEISVENRQPDLALRKYITKVERNGNEITVPNLADRVPDVDASMLNQNGITTATYKHRKAPVEVQRGDNVTYTLRVYNEGDLAARATQIVDHLPNGLELNQAATASIANGRYTASQTGRNVTINITDNTFINPFNNGIVQSYDFIKIVCTVSDSESAIPTNQDNVLTNIAEITQYVVSENPNAVDRDNENTVVIPQNLASYWGAEGQTETNPGSTNRNSYYTGQEDDDDFEKIIVPRIEGSYTINLRKEDTAGHLLNGATFTMTSGGNSIPLTDNGNGTFSTGNIAITGTGTTVYTLTETNAPAGYNKLIDSVILNVTTILQNGSFALGTVALGEVNANATVTVQGSTITLTIKNEKITGQYNIKLRKEDTAGHLLNGATFTMTSGGNSIPLTDNGNGIFSTGNIAITETGTTVYTITETNAPAGYNKLIDSLVLNVTTIEQNGSYVLGTITLGEVNANATVTVQGSTITLTIKNEKITGQYNIKLRKEDTAGNLLDGATFTMMNGANSIPLTDNNHDGIFETGNIAITETGTTVYTIVETEAPEGYNKLIDSLTLNVTTVEQNGSYVLGTVTLGEVNANASVSVQGSTITLIVKNEKIAGQYNIKLRKVDDDGHLLNGAAFTMTNGTNTIPLRDSGNGVFSTGSIAITEEGTTTYTIEETEAPTGYEKLVDEFSIIVTTGIENGQYVVEDIALAEPNNNITVQLTNGTITINVVNKLNIFDLSLRKYISSVIRNGEEVLTDSRVPVVNIEPLLNGETTAEYKHRKAPVEVKAGDKITYTLTVYNEGKISGRATEIVDHLPEGLELDETATSSLANGKYTVSQNGRNLTIRMIDNYLLPGFTGSDLSSYSIQIVCKISDGLTNPSQDRVLTNIAEITEYVASVDATDRDNESLATVPGNLSNYWGHSGQTSTRPGSTNPESYYAGQEDDDDFEKVFIKGVNADFSLRKYITKINGTSLIGLDSRVPNIDISGILPKKGTMNEVTTATYKHKKSPVAVKNGDEVTYTITVYNEGDVAGSVTEIVDHLPVGLVFDSTLNPEFIAAKDSYTDEERATYKYSYQMPDNQTLIIRYLEDYTLEPISVTSTELDKKEVEVVCRIDTSVFSNLSENHVLTNIAEITEYQTPGNVPDRDNEALANIPGNLSGYWGKSGQTEQNPGASNSNSYYEGQEDDDDFEKVVINGVNFDLSLRKFISSVKRDGQELLDESREPIVDVRPLQRGANTANYTHPKIDKPVVVKNGDIITYTIRVYNEGDIDGYANIITDHIPEGLEFITNSPVNTRYLWTYENPRDLSIISTNYLSKARTDAGNVDGLIEAYDGGTELDYRDVQIEFKVVAPNTYTENIVNIAEIKESVAVNENNVVINVPDRDSVNPVDLDNYELKLAPANSTYQEDDDDYEVVQLRFFDLALRKFITAINEDEVTGRVPEAQYNESTGNMEYVHPKTPVEVSNADLVTYTIRVYNEGTIAGYAELISDDIPEGLIYVPGNETNILYRWKMIDENGEETNNITQAVRISTDYLSEANGEAMMGEEDTINPNLINPFNPASPVSNVEPYNPDFRDVKIVFQVDESAIPDDRIIINHAQISEDSDDDDDSTPDEWIDTDDDQDIEKVYVRIFDLSLQKWVTHTIVSVDGEVVVTETGFGPNVGLTDQDGRPNSENEPVAQVVIDKNKLNSTIVKFVYAIRVANEGEIAGYATEITDYIPQGLRFVEEDNPLWTKVGEDRIVTHALEETLLEPGDSAVLEVVFTWINGEDNLGVKTNIAAITEDYNDAGDTPDIDSTPDNTDITNYEKEQEDDDDFALVILTLKTGANNSYIAIALVALAIVATGTVFIKRYVL